MLQFNFHSISYIIRRERGAGTRGDTPGTIGDTLLLFLTAGSVPKNRIDAN